MPIIYNDQLQREIIDAVKLKQGFDSIPNVLSGTVVPVIEVNPKLTRNVECARGVCSNATSANILVTDAAKSTYIVAAAMSVIKDVTSTSTGSDIRVTIGGLTRSLLTIPGITLTVQQQSLSITFNHPLKVDSGSTITLISSTAVANCTASANIIYYTDENGIN